MGKDVNTPGNEENGFDSDVSNGNNVNNGNNIAGYETGGEMDVELQQDAGEEGNTTENESQHDSDDDVLLPNNGDNGLAPTPGFID